jgi:hypothetical protein
MAAVKKQRTCIKFFFKLNKTAAETHRMLKEAFGVQALSQLPGFSCSDLVAVHISYNDEVVQRRLVVCSAYLPYDSEDPLYLRNLRASCAIVKKRTSIWLWGATPMHIVVHGAAPIAIVEGKPGGISEHCKFGDP